MRNIDNSDLIALRHYTPEATALLATLRAAAPRARVIAGGAAFGVAPEALFETLGVDYAVAGDGERATVALLDALAAGRAPGAIPGVVRRGDSGSRSSRRPAATPISIRSPPAHMHQWLDLARVRAPRRHGAHPDEARLRVQVHLLHVSQRGRLGLSPARSRSRRGRDGGARREAGVRALRVRRLHLQRAAAPRDGRVRGDPAPAACACISTPRTSRPPPRPTELLALMRRAGFRWLGITAESASDSVLERLQKGFDAAQVRDVAERVEARGHRRAVDLPRGRAGRDAARRSRRRCASPRGASAAATPCTSPWACASIRAPRSTTSRATRASSPPAIRSSCRDSISRTRSRFREHGRAPARLRVRASALHVLRRLALAAAAAPHAARRRAAAARVRIGATWASSSASRAPCHDRAHRCDRRRRRTGGQLRRLASRARRRARRAPRPRAFPARQAVRRIPEPRSLAAPRLDGRARRVRARGRGAARGHDRALARRHGRAGRVHGGARIPSVPRSRTRPASHRARRARCSEQRAMRA